MCCLKPVLHILPIFLVIWSCAGFIITFIIAVERRDVDPFIPFISDTGTTPPESCVFGLMINISSFLGAITIYIRYKILQTINKANPLVKSRLNCVAFLSGLLACLGMCIVANFQETALRAVHDIGALLAFGMGTVYLIFQAVISFKMLPLCNDRWAFGFRVFIAAVSVVVFVPMIACYFVSGESKLKWDPMDRGYGNHVTSALCEWIVAFCFNFFFLTYIKEFQKFTLRIKTELHPDFQNDVLTPILS
ncbi:DNA damage-regulated autophagy modulator protein 1 [Amblyraja radiata]|uniref:DNA damage-regulated autophagy modulator protein 1 n=1 Tax=Amblyraja radiata TaxID=386614 RepID=UPI001403E2A4|nr:DNA damage-regulated autophagy modulator protein 1 [Amblyraja radiata]